MLSMSSGSVSISDNNLEILINTCVAKLKAQVKPSPEIIRGTLDIFERAILQYTSKEQEKYLTLLHAQIPIITKKLALFRFIEVTHSDIVGITTFLGCYNNLFANMNKEDIPAYRCAERLTPVFDFLSDVLNEMIRINAYEDAIKDPLKQILARMHVAYIDFFFSHKNYASTIYHLQQKITIADSIANERLKQSTLDPSDVYILAMNYLECGDLARVENILKLERERCLALPDLYIDFCKKLSSAHSLQEDYPQAIDWINEALNVADDTLLHMIRAELMKANVVAINKHCSAKENVFILGQEPEFKESHKKHIQPDYFIVIVTSIAKWSPELIENFKRLAGKCAFDFDPGKLMVHKLSKVGVAGLTKIFDALNKLELQYQRSTQESSSSSQADQAIDELSNSMAALEVRHPHADLTPVCQPIAASSTLSCSKDPIAHRIKPPLKLKTRGKADKRKQAALKIPTEVLPSCHAERYGFSRALFGTHQFNMCRMMGDNNRLFYVVTGNIAVPNERGDHYQKFARLMAEPKIVPPCGEEGFKWMEVDGKQVLVGKVLHTKKRLFPTAVQRNDQGAIAFLYGTIVNTKRGIPKHGVKHYVPVPTLKRK